MKAWRGFRNLPLLVQIVIGVTILAVLGGLMGEPQEQEQGQTDTAQATAPSPEPSPTPTDTTHEDSSLACDHFRNVASDASDGLLTDTELREKLKEVQGNAIIATQEVQGAAKAMLRAFTQRTGEVRAIQAMDKACSKAGH